MLHSRRGPRRQSSGGAAPQGAATPTPLVSVTGSGQNLFNPPSPIPAIPRAESVFRQPFAAQAIKGNEGDLFVAVPCSHLCPYREPRWGTKSLSRGKKKKKKKDGEMTAQASQKERKTKKQKE